MRTPAQYISHYLVIWAHIKLMRVISTLIMTEKGV